MPPLRKLRGVVVCYLPSLVEWARLLLPQAVVSSKDLGSLRERLRDRVDSIPSIKSDVDFINQVSIDG